MAAQRIQDWYRVFGRSMFEALVFTGTVFGIWCIRGDLTSANAHL